ncbi:MAG: hypothetical protein H6818_19220 [Phycisphaerales bacterium]|nr:hypothetical protein [Phycisphaerales bacterium]
MTRGAWPISAFLAVCFAAIVASDVAAAPVVFSDDEGDAVVRRTDNDGDGPFDPEVQAMPDLLEIRVDSFAPAMPHINPFVGMSDAAGLFVRIDLVFAGLVNPPGPVGLDDHWPTYEPDKYGPNPVVGYIEFDMDGNEDTGGEDQYPELRYLANVARFGGLPSEPRFADRAADGCDAFDGNVTTAPYYEASGEEFHFVLLGEEIEQYSVVTEAVAGNPALFEAGEIWWIDGDFFHKAHAYDDFATLCGSGGGDYKPEVTIQFAHDSQIDRTTVTLVFPKTNEGSARLISPSTNVQSQDGCDNNQFSIQEVLLDLHFGALFADSFTRMLPSFRFIAEWENQGTETFDTFLDPSTWRVQALVGTAYLPDQVDDDEFIWTDVYPNPTFGDMNADGVYDAADESYILEYIAEYDGGVGHDNDGDGMNQSVMLIDWGRCFSVCDVNYDGFVNLLDIGDSGLVGDMNLDGLVDGRDIGPFVLALTDPAAYSSQYPSANANVIGDTNDDGAFDLVDVTGMLNLLLGPQVEPLKGDMNGDNEVTIDDVIPFCLALTDPAVYQSTHGVDPTARGDCNGDGVLDARDIAHFANRLVVP